MSYAGVSYTRTMDPDVKTTQVPHVRFYMDIVEDRTASEKEGKFCGYEACMVSISAPGSKDSVVKVAENWLNDLKDKARRESNDLLGNDGPAQQMYKHFLSLHKRFMEKEELPVNGTPLKTWQLINPIMLKRCLDVNIFTVEQLSECTNEAEKNIGLGVVDLKKKAKKWLEEAKSTGTLVNQITQLEANSEQKDATIEALKKQVATLSAKVEALSDGIVSKAKAKGKPKTEELED